jgi:hypothetical protein
MIKVSPLGAFYIGLTVKLWNDSDKKNGDDKKNVRQLILSGNVDNGLDLLHRFVHPSKLNSYIWSEIKPGVTNLRFVQDFLDLLCRMINPNALKNSDSFTNASNIARQQMSRENTLNSARRDVAFYFATMFKIGHLEQLPMPEFGYEMSTQENKTSLELEHKILSEIKETSLKGPRLLHQMQGDSGLNEE